MARTKSMTSIETEIAQAQNAVLKAKAHYEKTVADLEKVMAKKDELVAKELLQAYKESGKPYAVVMRYLKEGLRQ